MLFPISFLVVWGARMNEGRKMMKTKRKKAHRSWPQSEAIRGPKGFMIGGVVQAMCRNGCKWLEILSGVPNVGPEQGELGANVCHLGG
jgi:hypothetical protein